MPDLWPQSLIELQPRGNTEYISQSRTVMVSNPDGWVEDDPHQGLWIYQARVLDGKHGVTDDPAGETYWKIANGIRMTGMPSFKSSLSDTQMWQVSLMLADADKLPADVSSVLKQPLPKERPAAGSAGGN